MRLQPKRACAQHRIDGSLPPPCGFIVRAVDLAMVASTQGDGELIADLVAERPALCEAQMVSIRRSAIANQAGLLGYIPDVIPIANPARLRQSRHALIDHLRSRPVLRPLGWMRAVRSQRLLNFVRGLRLTCGARRKARQSGLKTLLHGLRVG